MVKRTTILVKIAFLSVVAVLWLGGRAYGQVHGGTSIRGLEYFRGNASRGSNTLSNFNAYSTSLNDGNLYSLYSPNFMTANTRATMRHRSDTTLLGGSIAGGNVRRQLELKNMGAYLGRESGGRPTGRSFTGFPLAAKAKMRGVVGLSFRPVSTRANAFTVRVGELGITSPIGKTGYKTGGQPFLARRDLRHAGIAKRIAQSRTLSDRFTPENTLYGVRDLVRKRNRSARGIKRDVYRSRMGLSDSNRYGR